ncbi:MAG: SDR family oxidoreductase [Planctomycetes bacterium]|nr:SDR family oxidoreductase [Planctomycetota bacterium]
MTSYVAGKRFLVTGASSGIGRAVAARLAGAGAQVAVMARTRAKLEELAAATKAATPLLVLPGDVTRAEDCAAAVRKTVEALGRLDGLIHVAGVSMRAAARDTATQVFRDVMEVNFFSMIHLFQPAAEHLVNSRGHLVAVSSMMGRYATQLRSGYAASKHALQGFLDSVRLELAPAGVHVMVVSPGFVKTDISLNALAGDGSRHGVMDGAIAGGLPPEAVADAILEGLERRRRDLYPAGAKEKLGLFLSKWSPARLDRLLLRSNVT